MTVQVKFQKDPTSGNWWAFFGRFGLLWNKDTTRITMAMNPTKPGGKFFRMTNPRYEYADNVKQFKQLAQEFANEGDPV